MASNPPQTPQNQEEEQEDEEEDEYEDEDEDEDEDYDPADELLNAAIAASFEEAMEVGVLEVPADQDQDQDPNQEQEGEEEEEIDDDKKGGREEEGKGLCMSQSDWRVSMNCPICFEPWTSDGPHRVCCIPCGHVYGKSCLEKWLQRFQRSAGKCPQCKEKFKHKEIINLYAPLIVVPNDDLEKEVRCLRENNEILKLENSRLQEEIKKQKYTFGQLMHSMSNESSGRQKMLCLERPFSGGSQMRLFAHSGDRLSSSTQSFSENMFSTQNNCRDGARSCEFLFQKEFRLDGARVMAIDASSQFIIISGKTPGPGVCGRHTLSKISLLSLNEIDRIDLPDDSGVIRDMCIPSNGLALLASLSKRLLLFSTVSNNCVHKFELPGPAWSCAGDSSIPHHIFAGLQSGTLLVFDLRQTSRHLASIEGLSTNPIHSIHSIVVNTTRKVLTASSAGPCIWDIAGNGERPSLIPEMDSHGVCISLACSRSSDDIVATFRPKVELSNDIMPSQTPVSSSPLISGSGRLGSYVLMKRTGSGSYEKSSVGFGNVSEVRMSKSAFISTYRAKLLFASVDESSRSVCLRNLPGLHVQNYLKPHPQPILDLKYAQCSGPGFLGCISDGRCHIYTCF